MGIVLIKEWIHYNNDKSHNINAMALWQIEIFFNWDLCKTKNKIIKRKRCHGLGNYCFSIVYTCCLVIRRQLQVTLKFKDVLFYFFMLLLLLLLFFLQTCVSSQGAFEWQDTNTSILSQIFCVMVIIRSESAW